MTDIIVTTPDEAQLSEVNIKDWSPWECEPRSFDWEYDAEEWCYLFEGKAKIRTASGVEVDIAKGNLVKFSKGLKCNWRVTEKIRKVYIFRN